MSSTVVGDGTVAGQQRLTYVIALRVLGAWLDASDALPCVRILETNTGFLVQQSSPESTGVETSQALTFDQVWELHGGKKFRNRSRERDTGYQRLLESIGHELDRVDAHMILLEEVDQDLLLTYLYPHYVGGFALLKQFSIISPEGRVELLRAAKSRKSSGVLAKGLSRLMGDA